jgi:hypothetical protein
MNLLPAFLAQAAPLQSDPWGQFFFGIDADKRFVLLIIAIGCLTGVICTVVGCLSSMWGAMHRRRTEAELKRELLDRGLSVDEITKIIEATAPPEDATERVIASRACGKKTG